MKVYKLKPELSKIIYGLHNDNLLFTEEAEYSHTPNKESDIITNMIKQHIKENSNILDACANVGGNTINFILSCYFSTIIAIEYNNTTYDVLKHNFNQLKDHFNNCSRKIKTKLINGNCIDYINSNAIIKDKIKIVFFDPPWGGKKYKQYPIDSLNLYLYDKKNKVNIIDIIIKLLQMKTIKLILLKCPFNFTFTKLRNYIGDNYHNITKIRNYYVILIKKNTT